MISKSTQTLKANTGTGQERAESFRPVSTLPLFIVFSILYLADAWLSLKFIAVDIANEGNPIIRDFLIPVFGMNSLYAFKLIVLVFVFLVFRYAETKRNINLVPLYTILITMMGVINYLSLQMISG